MSTQSDDIEKANTAAQAEWDEFERQLATKMEREGLVRCPACDGCGVPEDSDDDCRVCAATGTVAKDRAGVTALH